MKERINWIDWAKVFTITLVVLGHMEYKDSNAIFQNFIYSFHMPLFFLLSGYLYKPEKDIKHLINKNKSTLFLPYIYLNLITFLVFCLPLYEINTYSLKTYFISFITATGGAPAGACWFLISLFFCKVFSFYILKLDLFKQIAVTIVLPILAYILKSHLGFDFFFKLPTTMIGVIFFLLGYHINRTGLVDKIQIKTHILLFFFLTLSLQIILNNIQGKVGIYSVSLGNYPFLYFVAAINGTLMTILLCKLFDNIQSKFIIILSSGTLLILAFQRHIPYLLFKIIGMLNPYFETHFITNVSIAIITTLIIYFPIKFVRKHTFLRKKLIGGR